MRISLDIDRFQSASLTKYIMLKNTMCSRTQRFIELLISQPCLF